MRRLHTAAEPNVRQYTNELLRKKRNSYSLDKNRSPMNTRRDTRKMPAANVNSKMKTNFLISSILLSLFVGWLCNRSYELLPALISVFLGGAVVWFFLASPFMYRYYTHKLTVIRYISMGIGIALFLTLQRTAIPWLNQLAI